MGLSFLVCALPGLRTLENSLAAALEFSRGWREDREGLSQPQALIREQRIAAGLELGLEKAPWNVLTGGAAL
jgi:hypothetical protein